MSNEPDDLKALGTRLDALKRETGVGPNPPRAPTSGEVAIRFATELLSTVIVGGAIGFGLDKLFGTLPILTVVFFIAGAGAGIINVNRASKELTERTAAAARAAEEAKKEH
ncbi:MAG TPA: AtpZ/AtpI family protein [Rhizomicrobium sp.]|jgi:ATP synthase protein I